MISSVWKMIAGTIGPFPIPALNRILYIAVDQLGLQAIRVVPIPIVLNMAQLEVRLGNRTVKPQSYFFGFYYPYPPYFC